MQVVLGRAVTLMMVRVVVMMLVLLAMAMMVVTMVRVVVVIIRVVMVMLVQVMLAMAVMVVVLVQAMLVQAMLVVLVVLVVRVMMVAVMAVVLLLAMLPPSLAPVVQSALLLLTPVLRVLMQLTQCHTMMPTKPHVWARLATSQPAAELKSMVAPAASVVVAACMLQLRAFRGGLRRWRLHHPFLVTRQSRKSALVSCWSCCVDNYPLPGVCHALRALAVAYLTAIVVPCRFQKASAIIYSTASAAGDDSVAPMGGDDACGVGQLDVTDARDDNLFSLHDADLVSDLPPFSGAAASPSVLSATTAMADVLAQPMPTPSSQASRVASARRLAHTPASAAFPVVRVGDAESREWPTYGVPTAPHYSVAMHYPTRPPAVNSATYSPTVVVRPPNHSIDTQQRAQHVAAIVALDQFASDMAQSSTIGSDGNVDSAAVPASSSHTDLDERKGAVGWESRTRRAAPRALPESPARRGPVELAADGLSVGRARGSDVPKPPESPTQLQARLLDQLLTPIAHEGVQYGGAVGTGRGHSASRHVSSPTKFLPVLEPPPPPGDQALGVPQGPVRAPGLPTTSSQPQTSAAAKSSSVVVHSSEALQRQNATTLQLAQALVAQAELAAQEFRETAKRRQLFADLPPPPEYFGSFRSSVDGSEAGGSCTGTASPPSVVLQADISALDRLAEFAARLPASQPASTQLGGGESMGGTRSDPSRAMPVPRPAPRVVEDERPKAASLAAPAAPQRPTSLSPVAAIASRVMLVGVEPGAVPAESPVHVPSTRPQPRPLREHSSVSEDSGRQHSPGSSAPALDAPEAVVASALDLSVQHPSGVVSLREPQKSAGHRMSAVGSFRLNLAEGAAKAATSPDSNAEAPCGTLDDRVQALSIALQGLRDAQGAMRKTTGGGVQRQDDQRQALSSPTSSSSPTQATLRDITSATQSRMTEPAKKGENGCSSDDASCGAAAALSPASTAVSVFRTMLKDAASVSTSLPRDSPSTAVGQSPRRVSPRGVASSSSPRTVVSTRDLCGSPEVAAALDPAMSLVKALHQRDHSSPDTASAASPVSSGSAGSSASVARRRKEWRGKLLALAGMGNASAAVAAAGSV